ncbi:MAG: DNA mismatch repair endonuclease MutL [Dehalococcoidia bacterium]
MSIHVLPPKVAATIAAGEVVERPASVVKELVENAIDAGAGTIRVEIERGGLDLIRVSDDGSGISPDELELACQRHATSKLALTADLADLHTLGFRGEALPSIVAAADVQLASRTGLDAAGGAVRFRAGAFVERVQFGGSKGTAVTVRNLFAAQPARLKFLRSPAAESGQIAAAVNPYAIAYPEIRFALTVDGRQVLQTTGSGDLRDAAARVLGGETAAVMLDIKDDGVAHESGIVVRGLVGPPALTRATRTAITVFVNRRWVQPRRLAFAVEQAYDTLLMTGRHPVAVVFVELPPADVDVNVHPTKAEVRFRDDRAVFGAVLNAVRRTLVGQAPVPGFDPGAPLFDDGTAAGAMSEALAVGAAGIAPQALYGPQPAQAPLWQSLMRPDEHDPTYIAPSETDTPRMPLLRVLGQSAGMYVVAEGPAGMYLIDQHAAHERVLYERIRAQRASAEVQVQGLLSPVTVDLTPLQAASFSGYQQFLADEGFAVEPFGERAVVIRSVPAILGDRDAAKAMGELLDALAEDREPPSDDALTKILACHGSVRAGKVMAPDEMRELVSLLEECESPRTCPHGRPTMIHLSNITLEREFRRR